MQIALIRNIGLILLAVFLIILGLTQLVPGIAIPPIVTGIIALVAGIFILIGK